MILLRKLLALVAGVALTVLGLVGLVLPVMPGLILLLGAAVCFSLASRRFRSRIEQHLHRHPRYRRVMRRLRTGQGLSLWQRIQLGFWLTLQRLVPDRGR